MATGSSIGSMAGTIGGTAFLGPLGGALGGLLGGAFGGLFDSDEPEFQWQNYLDPGMMQNINGLMNSKVGAQTASRLGGQYRRDARNTYKQIAGNYRNPAVQANLLDRTMRTAQEGTSDAFIKGNQADQQTRMQGIGLYNQAQGYNLQRNAFEQGVFDMNNQPSFLDQAAQAGLGMAFGNAMTNPSWSNGGSAPGMPNSGLYDNNSNYGLDRFNQNDYGLFGPSQGNGYNQNSMSFGQRRNPFSPASAF